MSGARTYSDDRLAAAVACATSWRGVLRDVGLAATSGSALRSVRRRADDLGLDYSHFRGHRRWSEDQLADAVSASRSWQEAADRLGLRGGSWPTTLKGHAARLGLSVAHFDPPRGTATTSPERPSPTQLRRAAPLMAAAWFTLCGADVSWPLEPCAFDLVVISSGHVRRVQVKSSTLKVAGSWVVRITQSGRGAAPYDPDDVDCFFVVDGDLNFYLIPARHVGGLTTVHLSAYEEFKVDQQLSGHLKSRED